jgi:hypothetical protein
MCRSRAIGGCPRGGGGTASGGELFWARQAEVERFSDVADRDEIAVDTAGSSLVTGSFSGKATFAAAEPNETVLVSDLNATLADAFVAKYGPDGSFLWAKQSAGDGGTGDSHHICASSVYARGIAVDRAGNSLVTGDFPITATFGAGERNETALAAGSCGRAMFTAKYAEDGTLQWAKQSLGGGCSGWAVAVDTAGNSLVTGFFTGTTAFGPGESNETALTAVGPSDLFVAKYAP